MGTFPLTATERFFTGFAAAFFTADLFLTTCFLSVFCAVFFFSRALGRDGAFPDFFAGTAFGVLLATVFGFDPAEATVGPDLEASLGRDGAFPDFFAGTAFGVLLAAAFGFDPAEATVGPDLDASLGRDGAFPDFFAGTAFGVLLAAVFGFDPAEATVGPDLDAPGFALDADRAAFFPLALDFSWALFAIVLYLPILYGARIYVEKPDAETHPI